MTNSPTTSGIREMILQLCDYKRKMLDNCEEMIRLQKENATISEQVIVTYASSPLQIGTCGWIDDDYKKEIEKRCWSRMISILHLERYMLCSEFNKLEEDIENGKTPEFELEIVLVWFNGLKSLIYENIEKLVKDVFTRVTEGTYKTSKSYRAPNKKRNNNGIDKYFILYSCDRGSFHSAYYRPTITDDIEKVIYLLAGEQLPEITIRERMEKEKTHEGVTPYFRIKCYGNKNTHYWITDEQVLDRLNRIGSGSAAIIGENIKIKIFD